MSSLNLEEETKEITLTLVAQDGTRIECPYEWCKLSKLITITFEDAQSTEIEFNEHIATGDLLRIIVDYFSIRKGEAAPLVEDPLEFAEMRKVTTEENAQFIDNLFTTYGIYMLYDVTNIANYLDCASLLNLCCAKIASLVKNKPIKDMPSILNPENRKKGVNGSYIKPDTVAVSAPVTPATPVEDAEEDAEDDEEMQE